MLARRSFLSGALLLATLAPPSKAAASAQAFDISIFAEAQRQGKPILVAIDARWCPVCLVQRTILWALLRKERYQRVIHLVVDFDEQKSLARYFGARSQSTLVVYKDRMERGRSVGETNDRSIAELLDQIV
jgi:thiol-disulfide isomerase/thioredoxin